MEECYRLLTDQVDLVNPEGHRLVPDVGKLLPLGGPPGQVTIQPKFFFNKDLEYLISGDTARRDALLISKLKATNHPDFGLEELVPSLWIESERDYNISAAYVRSHMRILSVISIKTFERYDYAYLREIAIRRADYNEYKILEAGFKNMHLNDFEDLYLLRLQGKLNHLHGSDKVHLYNMLRENEVHKLSDGTLTRVLHKLDHMVKDFRLYQCNPGMENRIWSEDNKRRSEEFMENIRVIHKYHGEDVNPVRANIKQALGSIQDQERYEHVGPQDTRPQDGERSEDDDHRLDLADDLKKTQDHLSSSNTSHKTKSTTSKYMISHEESNMQAEHKINQKIAELKLVFF
nr:hypothetical protein [Tanacetum cinerariifolium]